MTAFSARPLRAVTQLSAGSVADSIAVLLSLAAWCAVAVREAHVGIALAAVVAVAFGVALCQFTSDAALLTRMFVWGYLARTVVCIAAYYQGQHIGTPYWTGSNSDSERFFVESLQSLQYAILSFEDPGFPFANFLMVQAGRFFGGAHYLFNIQLILLSGAMFGPLIYCVTLYTVGKEAARIAGWLGTFHPTDIAYSSGLMRDAVVAATGWAFVMLGLRGTQRKAGPVRFGIALLLVAASWALRSLSTLLLLGTLSAWHIARFLANARGKAQRMRRILVVGGLSCAALAAVGLVGLTDRTIGTRLVFAFFRADLLQSMAGVSPEARASTGLTSQLSSGGGLIGSVVLVPFWIMAPFPFFPWSPPAWLGGPVRIVDVLLGLGGLVSQLIFVAYLSGLYVMLRRREWALLTVCLGAVFIATLVNIITFGQIRYTMVHSFPLFFLTVGYAYQHRASSREAIFTLVTLWLACLTTLYGLYILLKMEMSSLLVAGIGAMLFALIASYGWMQRRLLVSRQPLMS